MDKFKHIHLADPRIPKSLQHLMYTGSKFLPENEETVQAIIDESRAEMDTPFDEIYHRQKKVIQDVIDTEKAL
jgi:hypothetical protein